MNYVVFDVLGLDWQSTPQIFATLADAQEYCEIQNGRYSTANPFIIRQLVEVAA